VLELLVAEAHQRLERHLVAQPVLARQLEHLGADERSTRPKTYAYVRPCTCDSSRRSRSPRNPSSSTFDRPGGRNVCVKSKSRSRMTSASMSQRTFFEALMQRA